MKLKDIALLLKEITSIDPRFGTVTEEKVTAWSHVLNSAMTFEQGIDFVAKHYTSSDKTMMPSDLNYLYVSSQKNQRYEAPVTDSEIDWEFRKRCSKDLYAKLALDKNEPYVEGGKPWKWAMGSGGYYKEALKQGIQFERREMSSMFNSPEAN